MTSQHQVDIISDALEYYDNQNEQYKSLYYKIAYISKNSSKSSKSSIKTDHTVYTFYDSDKKQLFTSRIEIIGKYYEGYDSWIWGWALPTINKSLSSIIRKVFMYGTDINTMTDGKFHLENSIMRNMLVTSRAGITSKIQVEIYCALASYLAKKPLIIPIVQSGDPPQGKYMPYSYHDISDVTQNNENRVLYFLYALDLPKS